MDIAEITNAKIVSLNERNTPSIQVKEGSKSGTLISH
jgi:hypothetical protein